MSVNGHTVRNEATNLFADVFNSTTTPGARVIISPLNSPAPVGTRNQNWRFISTDSDRNMFKIQSVLTGGYASVNSAAANQTITTSLTSLDWEVTVVGTLSQNFIIRLPNTNLVWGVPNGSPGSTNITIVPLVAGNNNTNQQWRLTNV